MTQEIIIYRSPLEKMFYDGLFDPAVWEFMGILLGIVTIFVVGCAIRDKYKHRKFRR